MSGLHVHCEALTCSEVEPLLPLVADGALEPASDPRLFAHLAQCAECQEHLARHDLITLAVGDRRALTAPSRVKHYRLPLPIAVAAAAGVAGICYAAYWMHGSPQNTRDVPSQLVDRTVIRVDRRGQSGTRPYYVVIDKDQRATLVDPQHVDVDGGTQREGDAVQVGFENWKY
jgi:hypothetical protein